jgi:hypothetical protein
MRNPFFGFIVVPLVLVAFGIRWLTEPVAKSEPIAPNAVTAPVSSVPTPALIPLEQHAAKAISLGGSSKLSEARKQLLAKLLASVAEERFAAREQQEVWITLIGVESGYDGRVRSHKGAIGLGQLMPGYKTAFGATCGLSAVNESDLGDDFVNLHLSACYFRELLEMHSGDLSLAMVSYVAGPYSHDVKKAKAGKQTGAEATHYVRTIAARHRQTNTKED